MNGQFIISDERKAALDAEGEAMDLALDIAADLEREFPPNRKDKSMDPNRAYQNVAGIEAPRVSPFDSLVNAIDELRASDKQFGVLADRLAGAQPQEVAGQANSGGGGGLMDVVERAITNIRAITINLNEHHARIERRL